MNFMRTSFRFVSLLLLAGWCSLAARAEGAAPVTPDATPEARELLAFLQSISGKYTLTGQHNFPNVHGRNSEFAAKYIGKTPVIFGIDMGFAKAGDTDSYLARPDIVKEAIEQYHKGAIVAICWHAVPPTADEPVTFRPLPGADPKKLESVQGRLLDEQFREVLTPGTPLYRKWCAQVDVIAGYLKQLQDAHVPVLWRPYHEMNGGWFWWGGRTGRYSTVALYRQIFDRFVNVDHLRNLIWVWSMDRIHKPAQEYASYFPGIHHVDVLALDVYDNDFAQTYYDKLVALSQGKPLALAEVGNPPSPEVLKRQPLWTYYMTWAGMAHYTTHRQYAKIMADPHILNLDDPRYAELTAPYRKACGLPPVSLARQPPDFSGTWVLDQDLSAFGPHGIGFAPAKLKVTETADLLKVLTTQIREYTSDLVTEDDLKLDGTETKSTFMNAPRVTSARRSPSGDAIELHSTLTFPWGPPGKTYSVDDTWTLQEGGQVLSVKRVSETPMGPQEMTMIFDRR